MQCSYALLCKLKMPKKNFYKIDQIFLGACCYLIQCIKKHECNESMILSQKGSDSIIQLHNYRQYSCPLCHQLSCKLYMVSDEDEQVKVWLFHHQYWQKQLTIYTSLLDLFVWSSRDHCCFSQVLCSRVFKYLFVLNKVIYGNYSKTS